eukprot:7502742-Pyramimonas_sp.AAC.1
MSCVVCILLCLLVVLTEAPARREGGRRGEGEGKRGSGGEDCRRKVEEEGEGRRIILIIRRSDAAMRRWSMIFLGPGTQTPQRAQFPLALCPGPRGPGGLASGTLNFLEHPGTPLQPWAWGPRKALEDSSVQSSEFRGERATDRLLPL